MVDQKARFPYQFVPNMEKKQTLISRRASSRARCEPLFDKARAGGANPVDILLPTRAYLLTSSGRCFASRSNSCPALLCCPVLLSTSAFFFHEIDLVAVVIPSESWTLHATLVLTSWSWRKLLSTLLSIALKLVSLRERVCSVAQAPSMEGLVWTFYVEVGPVS